MAFDHYGLEVRKAKWTLLEHKGARRYIRPPRHKLDWATRLLKRRARQHARTEIVRELQLV